MNNAESIAQAIAQEIEQCAQECERIAAAYGGFAEGPIATDFGKAIHEAMAVGASNCAAAIRARLTHKD